MNRTVRFQNARQPNQMASPAKVEIAGFASELKGLGFIVWDIGEVHHLAQD